LSNAATYKSARILAGFTEAFSFGASSPPAVEWSGPSLLSKQSDSDTVNLDQVDQVDLQKRSASLLLDPFMDRDLHSEGEVLDGQDLGVIDEGPRSEGENRGEISDSDPVIVDPGDHDDEVEDWEAELEEVVEGLKSHIRDWADLRTNIKKYLKKHSNTLPLSQLNQLMIICNFATLQLKGLSRMQLSQT
jgi:hypothetical protein